MKVIKIDKKDWAGGLERLSKTFQLFGPAIQDAFFVFKTLGDGELPDLDVQKHPAFAKIRYISAVRKDV